MIPVDGGGFDLSTPPGDPAALRAAARRLAAVGREAAGLRTRLQQATQHALGHWRGLASASFSFLTGQVGFRLGGVEPPLADAGAALLRWAAALEAAQAAMRDLQRRWRQAVQEADLEQRRLAAGLAAGPLSPAEILGAAQSRLGVERDQVRRSLEAAARAAAAAIAASAGEGMSNGLAASATDLARRAWQDGWGIWGSTPAKLLQKLNGLRGAAVSYGRLRLYAQWSTGLWARVHAAEATLHGELAGIVDTESLPALNAWMRFRQTTSAADRLLADAQPVAAFGDASSPVAGVIGKVGLPLAMAGDVATIVKPGKEQGAHATTTRVMAGANFAASGTLLAAGAGVVTLTPVGAVVVGGVLVGTAAYAVGDLVYENREAIGHGLQVAAGWTEDRLEDAGGWVYDEVAGAVHELGDGAKAVGGAVDDVRHTVLGWVS